MFGIPQSLPSALVYFLVLTVPVATAQSNTVVIEHDGGGKVRKYNERFLRYLETKTRPVIKGNCFSACTRFMSLPGACALSTGYFWFHGINDGDGIADPEASRADSKAWELPKAVALQERYGAFTFGTVETRPQAVQELEPGVEKHWRSVYQDAPEKPPYQVWLRVKATKLLPLCPGAKDQVEDIQNRIRSRRAKQKKG